MTYKPQTLIRSRAFTQEERRRMHAIEMRQMDSRGALPNYPMCAKCMRPVRAYGFEETKSYYEVWAECGHGGRLRERRKVLIKKPRQDMKNYPNPHWLQDRMRLLVFFDAGVK